MFQHSKVQQSDKKEDSFIDKIADKTKPEPSNASASSQGKGGDKK